MAASPARTAVTAKIPLNAPGKVRMVVIHCLTGTRKPLQSEANH